MSLPLSTSGIAALDSVATDPDPSLVNRQQQPFPLGAAAAVTTGTLAVDSPSVPYTAKTQDNEHGEPDYGTDMTTFPSFKSSTQDASIQTDEDNNAETKENGSCWDDWYRRLQAYQLEHFGRLPPRIPTCPAQAEAMRLALWCYEQKHQQMQESELDDCPLHRRRSELLQQVSVKVFGDSSSSTTKNKKTAQSDNAIAAAAASRKGSKKRKASPKPAPTAAVASAVKSRTRRTGLGGRGAGASAAETVDLSTVGIRDDDDDVDDVNGKDLGSQKSLQDEAVQDLDQVQEEWGSETEHIHKRQRSTSAEVAQHMISWEDRYHQLVAFHQKHGHVQVPSVAVKEKENSSSNDNINNKDEHLGDGDNDDIEDEDMDVAAAEQQNELAQWVHRQRKCIALLTPVQTDLLNQLNFFQPQDLKVMQQLKQKQEEKEQEKKDNARKRKLKQKKLQAKKRVQTKKKKTKIEDSDDDGNEDDDADSDEGEGAPTKRRQNFERWYGKLIDFKKKHGHTNVPFSFTSPSLTPTTSEEEKEARFLSSWVGRLRKKHKAGQLVRYQQDMLDQIEFVWEVRKFLPWEIRYNELVEYRHEFGNCRVPYRPKDVKYKALAEWIRTQRKSKKSGKLKPEYETLLNAIGFVWDDGHLNVNMPTEVTTWMEKYNELVIYRHYHGHTRVPQRSGMLGRWVHFQRTKNRSGTMDPEKFKLLNALGFTWIAGGNNISTNDSSAEMPEAAAAPAPRIEEL